MACWLGKGVASNVACREMGDCSRCICTRDGNKYRDRDRDHDRNHDRNHEHNNDDHDNDGHDDDDDNDHNDDAHASLLTHGMYMCRQCHACACECARRMCVNAHGCACLIALDLRAHAHVWVSSNMPYFLSNIGSRWPVRGVRKL